MNENNPFRTFLNPIAAIAIFLVLGVLFLLFSAIVGWDKGVLVGMARTDYARGLITYLFTVVTIGTAVLLIVAALTAPLTDDAEKRFQHGKEILALLLGVFGTIVGFYFGAEVAKGKEEVFRVAPLHLSNQTISSGEKFTISSVISGGRPPYRYGTGFDDASIDIKDEVDKGGWINKELAGPTVTEEKSILVKIRVQDANGNIAEQSAEFTVKLKR